jgi:N-glycosylase/DNA lyase
MALTEKQLKIKEKYREKKKEIEKRISEFEKLKNESGKRLFEEFAFCILTPQSNATKCAQAIEKLKENGLLYSENLEKIRSILKENTRFYKKKAEFLVLAFKKLYKTDFKELEAIVRLPSKKAREELIKYKGIGLKEASHFLRNIGKGKEIAILDRHILKNLKKYKVIKQIPKSMTKKKYFEIEKKMLKFCKKINIPPSNLDLLFWSEETGFVFK